MINETAIRARYAAIKDQLDERGRRLFVAAEKVAAGYGGTAAVSRATGVAHSTIIRGAKDLLTASTATARVRRKGAGRPALSKSDPTMLEDLRRLVEPATMGDPMRPLLWVSKSREKLAAALRALNHSVSANTVGKMLMTLGYSRQVNRKTKEGSRHPDRDAQFRHINDQVAALQEAGQPVISVDTKKKELIGEYKNGGSDYRPTGCPDQVKTHDFVDKDKVPLDEDGHGTHVASTIAAPINGIGMAGVAPNVTLVNLRAGQDSGFFFLGPTVDALTYAGGISPSSLVSYRIIVGRFPFFATRFQAVSTRSASRQPPLMVPSCRPSGVKSKRAPGLR